MYLTLKLIQLLKYINTFLTHETIPNSCGQFRCVCCITSRVLLAYVICVLLLMLSVDPNSSFIDAVLILGYDEESIGDRSTKLKRWFGFRKQNLLRKRLISPSKLSYTNRSTWSLIWLRFKSTSNNSYRCISSSPTVLFAYCASTHSLYCIKQRLVSRCFVLIPMWIQFLGPIKRRPSVTMSRPRMIYDSHLHFYVEGIKY